MFRAPAWPLRRTLAVAVFVMLAVLAAAAAVAGLGARDTNQRFERTTSRLPQLAGTAAGLLAAMVTQDAAARGYALTGDAPFRQQFTAARASFVQAADQAEKLPDLDPATLDLIRRQRTIADRWYREVGLATFSLRDAGRDAPAQQALQRALGRPLMDEFRAANADFQAHLETIQKREVTRARTTARRSAVVIATAIGVAALTGLGVMIYLRNGVQSPLEHLMAAVTAVRAGRLDARVPERGTQELRGLGAAFNEMVGSMESAETERAQLEQLKTDFISVVSHELRTPLTSIKGYTEMVVDGDAGDLNDEQREYLGVALSNTDRLVDLVNDLLDLSRIESGRFELERERIAVRDILEDALRVLRPLVEAKEQRLAVEIAPDLPPIDGDRRRLTQVAVNLLSNANKYTPAGGTITVSATGDRGEVVLAVRDTGAGMRPEDQAHLFERFYRVRDAGTRDVAGSGLGLAITRSIVELHGGRINVQSAFGVGSRFEVRLPVAAGGRGAGAGDESDDAPPRSRAGDPRSLSPEVTG
jgi:signal transduction histidine kinase